MYDHISTLTSKQVVTGCVYFFLIKQGEAEQIKPTQTCTQVLD